MKTINEIFKNKPELLQENEVKELIKQFRIQFQAMKMKHVKYWNKITDLTMNSELFVAEGIACENVVKKINNISFEIDDDDVDI